MPHPSPDRAYSTNVPITHVCIFAKVFYVCTIQWTQNNEDREIQIIILPRAASSICGGCYFTTTRRLDSLLLRKSNTHPTHNLFREDGVNLAKNKSWGLWAMHVCNSCYSRTLSLVTGVLFEGLRIGVCCKLRLLRENYLVI